jgi:glycosyltransferase involved in cell wall biosynthesis
VYPTAGGGALRAAALFEYLRSRGAVDVITFRQDDAPVEFPGARDLLILDLARHSRHPAARALRNLRRATAGRPPLLDRFSGFDAAIGGWLEGRRYRVAVIEHFWCAPYAAVLRGHAGRLVLDLHNIESELQARSAESESWPVAALLRRFAARYRALEGAWLPRFDDVLAVSEADAARLDHPRLAVFPNTIPLKEAPKAAAGHAIIFTGNLEYAPNIAAVRWFARDVWPLIRREDPALEWRLAGKNAHAIERYVAGAAGVSIVGEVPDAVAEIARAKVAVVPLLAGSGTRFKILEAWAAARPVVSTAIGAEGLAAIPERHLVIADGAVQFAQAVIRTVRSPGDLGANGRALYLDRYTTESGWKQLERIGL